VFIDVLRCAATQNIDKHAKPTRGWAVTTNNK
jgi:hypothetical protein